MDEKGILKQAKALAERIASHRAYLHDCAESGFDLHRTAAYVETRLREMGLTPLRCGRCGIVADIHADGAPTDGGGRYFLLRADMDALSLGDGARHLCGHDMHTAMLLGAAELLCGRRESIRGTVRLAFQSAEEILSGAEDMLGSGLLCEIENGCFTGHRADFVGAIAIHVMTAQPIPCGTVVISAKGESAPAADFFEITVLGRGCHGAQPSLGVDPIIAAAHVITALQAISARELDFGSRAAITIGSVNSGQSANVIPDLAVLRGSVRCFGDGTRDFIKTRLRDIAVGTAKTFRSEAEVVFTSGCPSLLCDGGMCDRAAEWMRSLLGDDAVTVGGGQDRGVGASEDFAAISREVPSVMLAISAGDSRDGYEYPLHHPQARFDERALAVGSAVYAAAAISALDEDGK